MKKNIWKRLLSLAMALVLVAGMLPMMSLTAYAATGRDNNSGISVTVDYSYCNYCDDLIECDIVAIKSVSVSEETLTIVIECTTIVHGRYSKHNNTNGKVKDTITITNSDFSCTTAYNNATMSGPWRAESSSGHGYGTERIKVSRAAGHKVTSWTNNNNGTHSGNCTLCGNSIKEDCKMSAANCTTPATCPDCGYVKGSTNNEHSWGNWVTNNNGTHTRTCSRNNTHTETKDCFGGTATCSAGKTCTDCKTVYSQPDPDVHNWGDWVQNTDGTTHTRICNSDSTHKETQDCSGGTATCTAPATCENCNAAYGTQKSHNLKYAVKAGTTNVCEETCTDCDHYATATLTAADKYYRPGVSSAHGTVTYSDNWIGDVDEDYAYAVDKVGTATAKVTLIFSSSSSQLPVTLTCNYQVLPLDIAKSYAEYWPHEYSGDALIPVVYYSETGMVLDSTKLTEGTDYTIAWDKTDLTQAGEYTLTVTGINNYTGSFTQKITIAPANLKNVSVVNNKAAFDYTGEAQKLDVTASGETVDGSEIAFTYRVGETGEYVAEPAVTDGGTHTVHWKASAPNHNDVTGSFTVTVNPANGDASVSVADTEYGDAVNPNPVSSTNGTDHVTYQYKVKGADDSTYTSEAPKLPGEYTVKATFAATDNYNATTATADFEITKRKVTATVMAPNKTYDGTTDAVITAIVVGVYGDTFEISGLTGVFSDANAEEGKTVTVDSSNASVTGTNVDYYEISFPASTTATIAKAAAPTITFPTVLNAITYGQKLEEAKLSFYTNDYGTFNWNAPTAFPNAGTIGCALDFYPSDLALQNYDWQDAGEAQWIASRNALCICPDVTVNKAAATITAAPTPNDLTYNGEDQPLVTAGSVTGGTMVYSLEKEGTYTETLPQAMDVDTYTVWYKVDADSNHTTSAAPASVTVKIKKANSSVDAPAAISGLVYNGREQTLVIPVESMGGTVYYSLDGVTYTDYVPKGINAQEYTVYYKVVGDANHNDMEPKTVTAKIAPWNIETASCKAGVWGGPFTYNGQEHTPTPQIDAWVDDYPVPESPYAPGADVRLTEGTDYTVTYSNNVNAGEAVVTFTGKGNYTGTITRKFTIDPKPITVTIADKTSVYGEAVAELTATDDGIVNNDTNVYSLTTTATSTANAGEYAITGTALDSNYAITFVGGTYTITKAQVNSTGTDMAVDYTAGMEVDLRQMFAVDENAGEVHYWITHLTGEGSFTSEPYLYRIDKAGTFTVKITTKETANYKSGEATAVLTVNPGDPGIGIVTAGVVNDTLETSAIVLTRENTDIDGTLTVDAEQTLTLGDNTIRYTFTPEDTTNYKVVKGEVTVSVVDTIAPVGTVSIDDNKWNDLWNTITFGLFFKETKTVKVEVATDLSGIAKVEYYDSATALSADAVKAITAWNDMGADYAQDVTAEDAKTFIYYIRITDNAGNVTYISTADATYDLTKPVISGITNGSTYYTTQKVTVTDTNLDSVTLNGDAVTGEIILAGNVDKIYTIVATDKAGNETTCTVTMKAIASISAPIDSIGESNVNSGNTDTIAEVEAAAAALDTTNATDAEKAAIKAITDKCDALQEVIADTAAEYERITDAIAAYDPDEVTSADKATLDKLAEDLEALAESGNLTDSEKTALETPTENLDAMIETVNEVTEESDRIADAVGDYDQETVKSSDKEEIEQLAEDIDALLDTDNLTDEERTALEGEKTKCENLLTKIEGTDALVDKLTEDVGAYDEDTVKSTDKAALEQLVEDIEAVIEGNTNITEEEKTELEALVDTVEDLLTKIEEVAQAPVTEDTEKVKDISSENVTPEDKEDMEKAKADLEDALTENAGNYTEDEKKAIQEEIDRIDDALEAIENVESVEETISELPAIDTVEPDDEDAIKAITDAKAEYDALTDHEKSLVDEDTKKKLDDLCAALVAYDIIKGEDGKYTQGGSKGLSFTANGAYSKFTGILVDNKVVDSKHYTAESGSTVITLKASYLDTLSTGKHTLTVVYTDGETSCEFSIAAKSTTPATGDNFNILLWTSVMIISLAAITVLLIEQKKRRYVK